MTSQPTKTRAGSGRAPAQQLLLSIGGLVGQVDLTGAPDVFSQPYLFIQGVAPTPESAHADPRSRSAFGFVQDDWRILRGLTLNLGVRYDVESVHDIRNYLVGADANNVQPRVGVAWEPRAGGRTLVRGGAGLYTQQHLLFYINRVQLEGPDGTATTGLLRSRR